MLRLKANILVKLAKINIKWMQWVQKFKNSTGLVIFDAKIFDVLLGVAWLEYLCEAINSKHNILFKHSYIFNVKIYFLELIPRPARASADPPLYLRLRMGRPIGKVMPLPTAVMSYGKNKLKPEFIFSIPKNRTDELYRFLNTWVPHLYGELDEEQITARGYELIQHDTEWVKSGHSKVS